jgi:squalene-hopene/tetraprenyl-beta-curcumene cyclase
VEAVESGRFREPSPIGFYFAKLWYFEKLYPLIFTVAALGRAVRNPVEVPRKTEPL